jgi:signal transduction histidine kinase
VAIAMEAIELYRTQRDEAEVANALARFARDLMTYVHQPDFLDRLCATTADVLHCHISSTLVKQPESDSFVSIAGHGYATDVGLGTRNFQVPVAQMSDLLARLADDDVAVIEAIPETALPRERQQEFHLGATLCMALRQGGEIVGLQVAHRSEGRAFGWTDLRIARGFAQIASLAISHAKLVEELERANRVRSEFVATVSHELRTPLNIILGYGDLLLTDTFGPLNEEQRGTLQRMDRRARELLELVNSTLEVSRLERGQVPIDVQATSLRDLLATIDAETHELQERAGIVLALDVAGGDVELRTDPAKLKVVLKNLVVNALKFTEQGSVTVRVTAGDDDATIAVTDTGIGIPRDALDLVFQAFRQAHAPTTRGHGGVGLGLFIVARFVELLRGTVSVESQVGIGSTFVVTLPRDVTQRSVAPGSTID